MTLVYQGQNYTTIFLNWKQKIGRENCQLDLGRMSMLHCFGNRQVDIMPIGGCQMERQVWIGLESVTPRVGNDFLEGAIAVFVTRLC